MRDADDAVAGRETDPESGLGRAGTRQEEGQPGPSLGQDSQLAQRGASKQPSGRSGQPLPRAHPRIHLVGHTQAGCRLRQKHQPHQHHLSGRQGCHVGGQGRLRQTPSRSGTIK